MRNVILLIAALLTTSVLAIEPPKPQTPPATPADQPATPAPTTATPPPASERPDISDDEKAAAAKEAAAKQAAEDAAVDAEQLPPLPDGDAPAGPPAARFNPTEKVRADFPVSFPIDI